MNILNSPVPVKSSEWEYVLEDLLEMGTQLKKHERQFLLEALRSEDTSKEAIEVHPAFSVGKQMVIILEKSAAGTEECWIFSQAEKKIRKIRL
ncbi:MAG: hypothetical protein HYZ83_07420 [Candidatus Omnitrophica bacterium]|nr:hypothetical protein [Candidatus Omnitrophota bacterium]